MASRHMSFFRKYQKMILVTMGVILMVTFTVGGSLSMLTGGGSGPTGGNDSAVVTWRGGKVTESQLESMRHLHVVAVNFLRDVIITTLEKGGSPTLNGQSIPKTTPPQAVMQGSPGIPADDSDFALIRTMLLAKKADEQRLTVDQKAVREFLKQLSDGTLGEPEWEEIARNNIPSGMSMSFSQLLDQIAYELKAQHMRVLSGAGLMTSRKALFSTGQAWDYHNRLNRRFAIEAFPVEVEPLMTQVGGAPTEAELQALFEQGRSADPNPSLPEPGFHKPHKVAFDYLKVEMKPFVDEAKKKVTDEAIAKQYELGKSQGKYKQLDLPPVEATPPATDKPADKPATDKPEEKPAADKPATEKPATDKPEEKPATDKPAEEKKPGEKPAEAKPATDKPAEPKPADKPAEPSEEKKPCGEDPADDKPAEPKPAEPKPAEPKPAETKPAETKPAETKPAETKPADTKPADPKPAETKPAEEKPADTKPVETKPEPAPEPKFKPLAEVADDIRAELAQPIAQEARDAAVKKVLAEINEYGRLQSRWLSMKDRKTKSSSVTDPGKLEAAALAKKYGFVAGRTPLVDRHGIDEHELGQKVRRLDMQALQRGQFVQLSLADFAFGSGDPLYSPQEEMSTEQDATFIFWRTAEQTAEDVTLKDVRDQVVAFWKKQQAFKLAQQKANEYVEKAKGVKSLKEVVDPAQVITPPPFSWLTTGSVGFGSGQLELSPVLGVKLPGRDFMEAVFALQPTQVGTAPNQSQSTVYVVHVLSQEPTDEVLRQQFLDSGTASLDSIAEQEIMLTLLDWYKDLEKDMRLVWQRPARNLR